MMMAAAVVLLACGGGKYSEFEQVLNDEVDLMQTFVDKMEAADNAGAVADALNGYSEGMQDLIPRLEKLSKEFPEIETRKDLPPELEKKIAQVDQLTERMQGAIMKTMQYMQSPEVQQAMENFGNSMPQRQS
jgi:hypothetical protein